jgi:hypothetical protein
MHRDVLITLYFTSPAWGAGGGGVLAWKEFVTAVWIHFVVALYNKITKPALLARTSASHSLSWLCARSSTSSTLALPSDVTTYNAPEYKKKGAHISMKLSYTNNDVFLHEENCSKLRREFPVANVGTLWAQTTLTPDYPNPDTTGWGEWNTVLRVTHQTREGMTARYKSQSNSKGRPCI